MNEWTVDHVLPISIIYKYIQNDVGMYYTN